MQSSKYVFQRTQDSAFNFLLIFDEFGNLTFASKSHSWLIGFIQVVEPFVLKAKFIH